MSAEPTVIDTHQHLWDPQRFRYAWLEDFPTLDRRAMLDEYDRAAADVPIAQTIYVDTDVDESDLEREIAAIFALADAPGSRIGGVVPGIKLEQPDCFRVLEPHLAHPKLKGVRRVLHTQPDELSISTCFRDNLRSLGDRGFSFDLCVLARQLPLAEPLLKDCPHVQFVLDHCGIPDVKGKALDPWRENIRWLSDYPNLVCKVSGLVAYSNPERWSVDDLRPFFGHVVESFGWERVLWGGDWPVCTLVASMKEWYDAALTLTASATAVQRAAFFADNAVRVYRLSI